MTRIFALLALVTSIAWATEPKAKLPIAEGELHEWTYCAAKSLVAVSQGKQLLLGRLEVSQKKLTILSKLPFETWAMAFSPDCSLLLLSESSGEEKHRINHAAMWRVGAGKLTRLGEIDTFRYPVATAAWTNDGKWLAVAANSGELNLYRVEAKGATTRSYQAPVLPEGDQYLRIRWGNGKLVGGTYKGSVHLYTLEGEKLSAPEVLMSPTGPTRKEGSLNVNSGAIVMPGGARVMGVAMSGDRPWAVVESGRVFTWDSTGTRITVVDQLDGANALALSPDGTLLAASGNYEAKLWRLEGTKATPAGTLDGLVHVEKYVAVDELLFVGKRALLVGSGNLDKASLVLY